MRRFVLPLLLTLLLPACAFAQQSAQQSAERDGGWRLAPAFGLHYGTPLRFSVAGGIVADFDRRGNDGLIALVEQGQHGHEFSAGYFRMYGRFGSGVSVRATALRTAGEPWNADPHTTYVGGEMQWMLVFGVGARAGYFRRASRDANGTNATIATLGVSIGG